AFLFPMLSMMNIILPGPKPLISDVRQSEASPISLLAGCFHCRCSGLLHRGPALISARVLSPVE
ncbi:hypothetical protein ACGFY6_33690, partial [Streptomyces sp. NPDC048387]|uniref:hypothetical protein n=1 Tax=Streptomyces sp. NPDC048387 TaxID=3365542 RepID=UPI00371AC821